jgi:hypothetical protein
MVSSMEGKRKGVGCRGGGGVAMAEEGGLEVGGGANGWALAVSGREREREGEGGPRASAGLHIGCLGRVACFG